jgi:TRAP-type mannitol/chloroaromatic compound transport system substrate-binding protein
MLKRIVTAAVFTAVSCSAASAADFNLRFQSFWHGGTANQQAFQAFADEVRTLSNGRIAIEALPADAIVPSTEMIDATVARVLHSMHGGGALHIKKDPDFALVNDIPAGYDKPE